MNSFRAVQRALEFEIERQTGVLDAGGTLVQETRGWVEAQGRTISQRSKEQAHDYRYFPEPDLPPLRLGCRVRRARARDAARASRGPGASLPGAVRADRVRRRGAHRHARGRRHLRGARRRRCSCQTCRQLAERRRRRARQRAPDRRCSSSGLGIDGLAGLLRLVDAGTINGPTAKELLAELYVAGGDPEALVRRSRSRPGERRPPSSARSSTRAIAANPAACGGLPRRQARRRSGS